MQRANPNQKNLLTGAVFLLLAYIASTFKTESPLFNPPEGVCTACLSPEGFLNTNASLATHRLPQLLMLISVGLAMLALEPVLSPLIDKTTKDIEKRLKKAKKTASQVSIRIQAVYLSSATSSCQKAPNLSSTKRTSPGRHLSSSLVKSG